MIDRGKIDLYSCLAYEMIVEHSADVRAMRYMPDEVQGLASSGAVMAVVWIGDSYAFKLVRE